MPDLSALSSLTTTAQALSNLVLVSPQQTIGYQPQPKPQNNGVIPATPPTLVFHYEGEQTVSIQSDITDHYIEDNTAIQDQVALRPEEITTAGFIGELNDIAPYPLQIVQQIANKLVTIGAYLPQISETALIAYNNAFQLYQVAQSVINSAVSTWGALVGTSGENVINSQGLGNAFNPTTGQVVGTQNKQQVAFQQFYGYWKNRTLFTVQTPWAVFQNMAIKNLRAVQDAETRVISTFEVTFKMIRVASTSTVTNTIPKSFQGRLQNQASALTNQGTSTPIPSIDLGEALAIG